MSLTAALEAGKAGMRIYQVATEVASENIANVNTPGYSRQRVVLETAPPTTHNGFPLASGVQISTVERYYDALLQKQLVSADTAASYDTKKSEVLQQIEPVFNEIGQAGLGAAITGFFNAWQDLSLNPTGQAERQGVIGKAQNLVDQFNYIARSLNDTISIQEESIQPQLDDINVTAQKIASLNGQISLTELVDGNANEIRDQRDYLVRQLSEKVGVQFTENNDGTTDVFIKDNSAAPPVDYYLVKGSLYGSVNSTATAPRDVTVTDYLGSTSNVMDPTAATPFYTPATSGGKLWATLTMRDVSIPGYLQQVDNLAASIVSNVNALHQTGFTPTGAAGGDVFNAAGTTAATIALSLTAPSQIAASDSPIQPGSNAKAVAMAQLLNANTMAGTTTTFSLYYNALTAQIGLDVNNSQAVVKQDEAFLKQLTALRESNSGVSLDEELVDLMKYQRSYQACAKLITTASEMMDVVVNLVR